MAKWSKLWNDKTLSKKPAPYFPFVSPWDAAMQTARFTPPTIKQRGGQVPSLAGKLQ